MTSLAAMSSLEIGCRKKKREGQASQIQTLRLANEESRREKRREQKVRLRHRTRHHLVKEERARQQAQLETNQR